MSDKVSLDAARFNFMDSNFTGIRKENIDSLISRAGRFSVTDDGSLVIITPPRKRDNFLVSFYKGRLQPNREAREAYRKQERLYDNMDKLARNLSFQQRIMNALVEKQSETVFHECKTAINLLRENIRSYISQCHGAISTTDLFQFYDNETTNNTYKLMNEAVVKEINLTGATFEKGRIYGEKGVNVFDFIQKNLPPGTDISNDKIFVDGKLNTGLFTSQIIRRCIDFPRDFEKMELASQARAIRNAQFREPGFLSDVEKSRIYFGIKDVISSIQSKFAGFLSQAYSDNKNRQEVAVVMYDMLKTVCGHIPPRKKSGNVLSEMFSEKKIQKSIAKLKDDPALKFSNKQNISDEDYSLFRYASKFCGCKNVVSEVFRSLNPVNAMSLFNAMSKMVRIKDVADEKLNVRDPEKQDSFNDKHELESSVIGRLIAEEGFSAMGRENQEIFRGSVNGLLKETEAAMKSERKILDNLKEEGPDKNHHSALLGKLDMLKNVLTSMQELMSVKGLSSDAKTGQKIQKLFANLNSVNLFASDEIRNHIAQKVNVFPPSEQGFAGKYISYTASLLAGGKGGGTAEIKTYIDSMADKLLQNDNLRLFASDTCNSNILDPEVLDRFFFEDEKIGLKKMFSAQKEKIGSDGIHEDLRRDIAGMVFTAVGSNDFSEITDVNDRTSKVIDSLKDKFGEPYKAFLPFVSSALMQGGISSVFTNMFNRKGYVVKDGKNYDGTMLAGTLHTLKSSAYNEVDLSLRNPDDEGNPVPDGKPVWQKSAVISMHQDFGVDPVPGSLTGLPGYSDNRPIFVKGVDLKLEINLEKGVYENGVPKEMRVVSVTENYKKPAARYIKNYI